jgi:hypothetical protein
MVVGAALVWLEGGHVRWHHLSVFPVGLVSRRRGAHLQVEAFFSALAGYLCWRIYKGGLRLIPAAGLVLAVSAGIRPSSLFLLAPLYLASLLRTPPRQSVRGLFVLGLALLAWFIPMIRQCGGLYSYFSPLISLWRTVPAKATVLNSSPASSIVRLLTIDGIYLLCFGPIGLLPLRPVWWSETNHWQKRIFTSVWIAPALVFFSFVFLKFVNSGYLLLLFPPVCVWMGKWASEWYANALLPKALKLSVGGAAIAANVLLFLSGPAYCSYAEIRRFERELGEIRTALPQIASARDTLIVGFDSHFLGYHTRDIIRPTGPSSIPRFGSVRELVFSRCTIAIRAWSAPFPSNHFQSLSCFRCRQATASIENTSKACVPGSMGESCAPST